MDERQVVRIEDLEAVPSGVSGFIVLDGRRGLVVGDVRVADDGRFEAHRSDGYFAGAFKTLAEATRTLAGDR